jgi:hypothetical protein
MIIKWAIGLSLELFRIRKFPALQKLRGVAILSETLCVSKQMDKGENTKDGSLASEQSEGDTKVISQKQYRSAPHDNGQFVS